jgi:glycosyltransferase involved in cell wall biosynthesis
MKICLISMEIFAWGRAGGYGKATRTIGRELARRGHEVFAVVPRRSGQKPVETLDGITVLGFNPYLPWTAIRLFRECDADIYHSCEVSSGSVLAMRAMPGRRHMVTFRDPRDWAGWKMEFALPSLNKGQVLLNYLYENNVVVRRSIRRMDAVFTIAKYLIPKVKEIYGLSTEPGFLPTPVAVPASVRKADAPTVCYVARLDRRKRPTLFLDLAKAFPDIRFIAMGRSRDGRWEAELRSRYAGVPNLEMTGFVDQFRSDLHSEILGKSWVMVNTATREALPNAFLEAAAHRCAILSYVDPDGFASGFGYHAGEDDFAKGLAWLLEGGRWRALGEEGHAHVVETFELGRAVDAHEAVYRALLVR